MRVGCCPLECLHAALECVDADILLTEPDAQLDHLRRDTRRGGARHDGRSVVEYFAVRLKRLALPLAPGQGRIVPAIDF